MRRLAAVCVLAGAAFLAPSVALAEPSLNAAQHLCEAQGGNFQTVIPAGALYSCDRFGEAEGFSSRQLATAERLCENAYKGTFNPSTAPNRHSCFSS